MNGSACPKISLYHLQYDWICTLANYVVSLRFISKCYVLTLRQKQKLGSGSSDPRWRKPFSLACATHIYVDSDRAVTVGTVPAQHEEALFRDGTLTLIL